MIEVEQLNETLRIILDAKWQGSRNDCTVFFSFLIETMFHDQWRQTLLGIRVPQSYFELLFFVPHWREVNIDNTTWFIFPKCFSLKETNRRCHWWKVSFENPLTWYSINKSLHINRQYITYSSLNSSRIKLYLSYFRSFIEEELHLGTNPRSTCKVT